MWISLVALLIMPMMMINVATAPVGNTKLYIDPARIPVGGGTLGHPGDTFDMAIKVANIKDLWSIALTVQFAPFGRPIIASNVEEGDFLKQGGWPTSFTYKIDTLNGRLKIGVTRYWQWPLPYPPVGADGDGTLATFKFSVREAGESNIDIVGESLLDSTLKPIAHNTFNGNYYGPTADLIKNQIWSVDGRRAKVGDTIYFISSAQSHSDVPLIVRTRLDIERLDDGRRIKLYSGQRYLKGWFGEPPITYLYSNGYTNSYPPEYYGFDLSGNSPYVNAVDYPANYVSANYSATYDFNSEDNPLWAGFPIVGKFDFQDITLGPDDVVSKVSLEGYTYAPFHDQGGGRHLDFDTYMRPNKDTGPTTWVGSLWGIPEWGWHGVTHETRALSELPGFEVLLTQAGLNNARVRYIMYWTEDGYGVGWAAIDALRLKVEFASSDPASPPSYEIGPYLSLDLGNATMRARSDLVGTYVVTATLEYTLAGVGWMESAKTKTSTFVILP